MSERPPAQASKKKPKLSNQPTPKAPKKKKGSFIGKLVTVLSLCVLGFALFTMKQHSDATQEAPWKWDSQDWVNYLTLSRQAAEDAAQDIHERVKEIDWEDVRNRITEKTEKLWKSAQKLEKRIETRLQQEQNRRVEEKVTVKPKVANSETTKPGEVKQVVAEKSRYEKGLESMKKAILRYRKTPPGSKSGLEESERDFRQAQDHLQRAIDEVPDHQKPDVEDLLQECQQYLYDCQKRKTL